MDQSDELTKKRKRNVLSLEKKLIILKKHETGHSVSSLSKTFNVGLQTVRDIIKNKSKLHQFISQSDSSKSVSNRKTMKSAKFKELDNAMAKWFLQKRAEGIPISGPMCVQQAQYFHTHLKVEGEFHASSGWLYRFKKRHGIHELSIQGEKLSADDSAMVEFCYDLETVIQKHNLTPSQVYNADETGLYWKAMPTRTLVGENERSAPGFKIKKDRITVLCCANASGEHKLKLAVIGKSRNPRAFKNVNTTLLPVHYYHQHAAWMNRQIFEDWFFQKFIPEVRLFLSDNNLPQKAVLLLDNAPSHPSQSVLKSEDGNIFTMFFPPNVTSIAQPMDQGVIETMKRLFRKDLMMKLISENTDMMSFWKKLNIKDAIFAVARAWNGVKDINLKRAFWKIMTLEDDLQDDGATGDDELSSDALAAAAHSIEELKDIQVNDIEEWIQIDDGDPGFQVLTNEELVAEVQGQPSTSFIAEVRSSDEDSTYDDTSVAVNVSHQQALSAVDVLLDYFEQHENTDFTDILHLRRMQQEIRFNVIQSKKQTKLTDYFKKT